MSSQKIGYWWLNANPNIWKIDSMAVGDKEWYSNHNKEGNKRKIFKWFNEVKRGDLVLGYVTSPKRKIVAVCRITDGLHPTRVGDRIDFKIVEYLANPIPYEVLQAIPELANSEPLLNHQGSLFKLTQKEYELIRSLEVPDTDLIPDLNKNRTNKRIKKTTKMALQHARIGQGKYGSDVRRMWGNCCSVTGISTKAVLEASHIKSWAHSSNSQRLDPHNGLLLTANLHGLFDAGLVSFKDAGEILISSRLSKGEQRKFGLNGLKLLRRPSTIMVRYLLYHRKNTFK